MPFDKLTPRLQSVADAGMRFLIERFGRRGLALESAIHASIPWKPTFYLKPKVQIVAAEVDELLFPLPIRLAEMDVFRYEVPTSVYVICPLDIYEADRGQASKRDLQKHGIGLITVDDHGIVEQQIPCNPLQQHIARDEFDPKIRELSPKLRAKVSAAHGIYLADGPHGLQEIAQIVEGFIMAMAKESVRLRFLPPGTMKKSAASVIDDLYACPQFAHHRAVLGGAREFMKEYRNVSSHAPKSFQAALAKIHRCRDGFLRGVQILNNLQAPARAHKMKIVLH
jgi:hypothetical protein